VLVLIAVAYAAVVGTTVAWIVHALRANTNPIAGAMAVVVLLIIVFVVRTPITVGHYFGVHGSFGERLTSALVGAVGTAALFAFLDRAQIRNWLRRPRG
jgi:hypothetical protein